MFFKSCFSLINFVIMSLGLESLERSRLFWRSIRLVRSDGCRVFGEFRILSKRRSGVRGVLGDRDDREGPGCRVSLITSDSGSLPFVGVFPGCLGWKPLIG